MSRRPEPRPPVARRRSLAWRALGLALTAPVACFGARHIAQNASYIGRLWSAIRAGPQGDRRILHDEQRYLNLEAMASMGQLDVLEIERQLANRRRQTKRAVFLHLTAGSGFLGAWLVKALTTPAAYVSLPYVLGLLLFCGLFFLMAFYNALVNWQIRTGRLGTASEFLHAEETWWPS